MTAEEARELMDGSMKYKSIAFKLYLNWICGRINKKIEKAAELGNPQVIIKFNLYKIAKYYFPIITQLYEKQGYHVVYTFYRQEMRIIWDLSSISQHEIKEMTGVYSNFYDHHITLE